ncbi:flavodoxin [Aminipila sp.]|uniref:flavodoxin n=1 Tax=Aminipila sp. TaxID=2060095 RepID=UPI002897497F|nr:flavodoxin [Aminipila sp.]
MKKMAIIYWSGTGNTEKMAEAVFHGAKSAGADVTLYNVNEFVSNNIDTFDIVAFGCPSMGAEVLEETEFEPVYNDCRNKLNEKTVGVFGSYGWGDGEWMRNWEQDLLQAGALLPEGYLIINETPDESGIENCKNYGANLVK